MKIKFRKASNRFQELRKDITTEKKGVEIGAFFRPICPKRHGYNVTTIDVFTREELIKSHENDETVKPYFSDIEEVDIVSSEPLLEALQSRSFKSIRDSLDYIVSSHNFEHLPNPIKFLQDAEILLKPDGMLTMAIPIHSRCFDIYKPLSTIGNLIDAYTNKQSKPSLGSVVNHLCYGAQHKDGSALNSIQLDEGKISLIWDELEDFQISSGFNKITWFKELQTQLNCSYVDAHCHFFNPASFCLIISDLRMLGLLKELQVHDICEHGIEFIVQLKKAPNENGNGNPCSKLKRTALVQVATNYSAVETLISAAPFSDEALVKLKEMQTSRSWKITKPLRQASSFLGHLSRRIRSSSNMPVE
ncbi:class I SAM-dependent methyltransferase [Synechococcus lacustris]|uniref:class I SAM-dependent methyltransferase n=1 Tax=Synechococcus lacustris TaxID=2116544 RepID=UPI0033416827